MSVIGIDLGGTKVAAAVVTSRGRILCEELGATELSSWPQLKKQLLALCRDLKKKHPSVTAIGIGSAGPLHAPSGTLLDPTNFGWKKKLAVPLARELSAALKMPVLLENDAAAAALAERWQGNAGNECAVLTLGTGLGVGIIANGRLVRGGRGLHPEGGHIVLRAGDRSAPCGCGNFGCAEAYLSGKSFAARAGKSLGRPTLTGKEITQMALCGNPQVLEFFKEYSGHLAAFLTDMVVLYYPKKVILTGSFAEAHELFLPLAKDLLRSMIQRRLKTLPLFPKISVSKLGNRAGVLGGAYLALHPDYADKQNIP
jgi:glucokinase